jgi:hypothetical protein
MAHSALLLAALPASCRAPACLAGDSTARSRFERLGGLANIEAVARDAIGAAAPAARNELLEILVPARLDRARH